MLYKQWHALPDDAKKIWDMLSPEAKTIILHPFSANKPAKPPYFGNKKTPPQQHQALLPRQAIHEHEIKYLTWCLHELYGGDPPSETFYDLVTEPPDGVTSVHEDISKPDSQPLLAHVTKKNHYHQAMSRDFSHQLQIAILIKAAVSIFKRPIGMDSSTDKSIQCL